jgi:6,7-dimethyl-8-ribityllumazine synthase
LENIKKTTDHVLNEFDAIHKRSAVIHGNMERLQAISGEVTHKVSEVRQAGGQIATFLDNVRSLAR